MSPGSLRQVGRIARVLVASGAFEARRYLTTPAAVVGGAVQPVAFLLVVRAVIGDTAAAGQQSRLVLGVGLLSLWGATVWAAGGILRSERGEGTLPALVRGAVGVRWVLIGRSVGSTLTAGCSIFVSLTVVVLVLGIDVTFASPLLVTLAVLSTVLSAACLGLLLSCLFFLTRAAVRISEALLYPVFLLSGVLIPLSLLPVWLQWPSRFITLHWGHRLATGAALEGTLPLGAGAMLVALSAAYLLAGLWALRRALHRAQAQGTLELV